MITMKQFSSVCEYNCKEERIEELLLPCSNDKTSTFRFKRKGKSSSYLLDDSSSCFPEVLRTNYPNNIIRTYHNA